MNATERPPIPARLGKYEVRAKVGEGGMAAVYLGHCVELGKADRVVALKVIKDEFSLNHDFVTMFLDEAKIVSKLSHPNIVQVHELGSEGTRLFIAMELLFGQSLWHVWSACRERRVRLRYDVAAWIGARTAEGLHHAHELTDEHGVSQNLVHRDINASNIFVTYDGQVKIIDFGLAKAANRVSKTAAGVVKGKLAYMAPEQAVGQPLDRRCDIFALATSLWEITVDQRLFKGKDDVDTLKRVHAAVIPDPCALVEGYPPALWRVLQRGLARDVADRYPTAADFARDLDDVARALAPTGQPVGPQTVSAVMRDLFAREKTQQETWVAEAGAHDGRTPLATLRPPPMATIPPPPDVPKPVTMPGLFSGPPRATQPIPELARQQAVSQKPPMPPTPTPALALATPKKSGAPIGVIVGLVAVVLAAIGFWLTRR